MDECQNRINAMVQEAKEKAGLPKDLTLKALVHLMAYFLLSILVYFTT